MLTAKQRDALGRWYRRPEVVNEARERIAQKDWPDLEELIQKRSLIPLGRGGLPEYLLDDEGKAVLPSLNPAVNLEAWRSAIEVGWEMVESEFAISQDDVHGAIAKLQHRDWNSFMESVESRKRERGEG